MSRRSTAIAGSIKPLLLCGGLTAALLLAACGQAPAAAPSAVPTPVPAAPVTAQTATRGTIQQTLAYSGDIRAREQISVLPKNTGRVEQVLVDHQPTVLTALLIGVQFAGQIPEMLARVIEIDDLSRAREVLIGKKANGISHRVSREALSVQMKKAWQL